ncbi:MAG: ABC transporter [Proteobacteria bacterium]|nr:MAG: ABC transporter [Pseudomonadota bacterium]
MDAPPESSSGASGAHPVSDLVYGAFSDDGPWRVEPTRCTWRRDVDALRATSQAQVPEWLRARAIPPLRRFGHAAWDVGGAVTAWWLLDKRRGASALRAGLSRRLRRAFERLGSSYIKLAQIVSSGKGIFPDELVEEFKLCRDRVPAEPFSHVREVLEAEFGRPLGQIFSRIDETPLASASIAQVHAATLHPDLAARLGGGREVVVKVQRPRIAELVRQDVAAMAWIAPYLVGRIPVAALANPPALVELFAETVSEELDFRLEAQNMLDVAHVLRDAGQSIIVVPRPHPELVARRALVMERLDGFHADDIDGMRAAGIDTAAVLRSLMIAFLEGAMIYGVFHGDLHGGNLVVMRDGRVGLFDYGMTGRMAEPQRLAFLRMMMTGAANDVRGQLAAFRDLGALDPDADLDELMRILKVDQPVRDPTKMSSEELVREIQTVLRALLKNGARLPKHLMLYVKNMLFIDGSIGRYAPDEDVFGEIAKIYGYFAQKHGARILADVGFDPSRQALDLRGVRAGMGLEADVTSLSPAELQQRRETMRKKLEEAGPMLRGKRS